MRIIAVVLVWLLSFAVSAQQGTKPEYERNVTGEIEIAVDGTVHGYKLDKGISPGIDKALDKAIRGWTFEPISVDGRPVIARTRMQIALQAVPVGEDYAFRVERTWFGMPTRRANMKPPRYPESAAHANLGAKVVMVLRLDAAGNVIAVHPEQTSLGAKAPNDRIAESWRRAFEQASIAAAKRWKFEIGEIINGAPVESSVRVPVEYMMGRGADKRWHGYIPGPYRPAPWVNRAALASDGIDQLKDGDMQALDSRFKLKTEVVGVML